MKRNYKVMHMTFLILLCLCGAVGADQEQDERAVLQARRQALQGRVDTLTREQDFLVFQQEMYAQDSKYLVLNIAGKRGQLKYKNRVLKNFRFTLSKNSKVEMAQPGSRILTKKADGKNGPRALAFGPSLILQTIHPANRKKSPDVLVLFLSEKDMVSVFYAVEPGAQAYLVP